MINHFKKHSHDYLVILGVYVLPLVLNVIIFRIERPQNIPLELIAACTLAPIFNLLVPAVYIVVLILKTIGELILL